MHINDNNLAYAARSTQNPADHLRTFSVRNNSTKWRYITTVHLPTL